MVIPMNEGKLRTASGALLAGMAFWLCAAAPSTAPVVQSYNTYKSWLVTCDNTLQCEAKGFDQERGAPAQFSITREAGPQGKLHALITAESAFGAGDIKLDDRTLSLPTGWHTADPTVDGPGVATDSLAALRAFVEQIRNGKALALPGDDGTIPLDGLTAALLRIDDRQGRVGGETAILNPGAAPAAKVPAASLPPHIPAHPITASLGKAEAAALIAETRHNGAGVLQAEQCDADVGGMEPAAYALDDHRALVLIPCIMGAYQGSFVGFLTNRSGGKVRELRLPAPYQGDPDPDHGAMTDLTEGDFDPATGTLSMSAKGRGLADCGASAKWVWSADDQRRVAGARFRLAFFALQEQCGGEAGDWPVLFRSTQ